jgi:hypothetical protein
MNGEAIRCFADADIIETFQSSLESTSAADRRDQYYYPYTFLHIQHRPSVPVSMIGKTVRGQKWDHPMALQNICRSGYKAASERKTPILAPNECRDIASRTAEGYVIRHPMTMQDITHHITEQYGQTLGANSIKHMLVRDPRARSYSGLPMEERRLQVTGEDISTDFTRLSEVIDGVPTHFISSMDEMGHQEWADRQ